MLTPNFVCSQTNKNVVITIVAPSSNVAKTELIVEDNMVYFHSFPYYLRLHLPGKVEKDPCDVGQYISDTGQYIFKLLKMTVGEHFENLDMLGSLLTPPKKYQINPSIELCEDVVAEEETELDCEGDEELWYIKQIPVVSAQDSESSPKYGFANKQSGMAQCIRDEFYEILDIIDVVSTPENERTTLRESDESASFSDDHYLADFMEPGEIDNFLRYTPSYVRTHIDKVEVELTFEEREQMKNIGNRDYILSSKEKRIALLSLFDILYAYCYNNRTTLGENTVESGWTINKLSATLSWFQSYQNIQEVMRACYRRSLTFPLYRNWNLSRVVFKDVLTILRLGRRQILKCFLEIHKLFNLNEPRFLLNQLYITDYCIWIQKASDLYIAKLGEAASQFQMNKNMTGFDLEELEIAAQLVQEEELINKANAVLNLKTLNNLSTHYCVPDSCKPRSSESEDSESDSDSSSSEELDSDDLSSPE